MHQMCDCLCREIETNKIASTSQRDPDTFCIGIDGLKIQEGDSEWEGDVLLYHAESRRAYHDLWPTRNSFPISFFTKFFVAPPANLPQLKGGFTSLHVCCALLTDQIVMLPFASEPLRIGTLRILTCEMLTDKPRLLCIAMYTQNGFMRESKLLSPLFLLKMMLYDACLHNDTATIGFIISLPEDLTV